MEFLYFLESLRNPVCDALFSVITMLGEETVFILVGLLFFCAGNAKQQETSIAARVLLWVSKYEYGIYLWHLLIMNNLLAHSGLLQALLTPGRKILAYIMLIGCSIVTGHIMTVLVNGLKLPAFPRKKIKSDTDSSTRCARSE